ncbi:hypothetical protein ABB37_09003 [Leptomonas pyrrhocoris]|uniref:Uncharacterized protein n=1 Tax=Leptomonas pyrrhocoris TaxID=157538 RepID=A0A0M9FS04_LEPPY|nr:hypothetical protein ABB37_09003 [Leptomonas pyrrhocoris]KPA74676.1 hypothetical protein ABB37_09003 [Leptomonas pyrrhocoris]|eukprot:XP_015653115.1 hypothetical protein ABB37_09003 [Leptomonas pyrrhocoris]
MGAIFCSSLDVCARHASTEGVGAPFASPPTADRNKEDHNNHKSGKSQQEGGPKDSSSSFSSPFEAYRDFRQARHKRNDRQYQTLSMYLDRLPPGLRELLLYSPLLALLYFVLVQARVYYLDEEELWYRLFVPARWRYHTTTETVAASSTARLASKDGTQEGDEADGLATQRVRSVAHVSSLLKRAPASAPVLRTSTASVVLPTAVEASTTPTEDSGVVGHETAPKGVSNSKSSSGDGHDSDAALLNRPAGLMTTTYRYRAMAVHDAAAAVSGCAAPPLVAPFHEVTVRKTHAAAAPSSPPDAATLKETQGPKAEGDGSAAAEALARAHPYGVWGGPLQVLRDPTTGCVMGYSASVTP